MKFFRLITLCSICLVLTIAVQAQGSQTIEPFGAAASGGVGASSSYVNLATGTANYAIPLASVSSGPLSFSLSASYASDGDLLQDMGGEIGLGWHLNLGGQVSREIRGLPDDYNEGWIEPSHHFNKTLNSHRNEAIEGKRDSEADSYSWSAGGYAGTFVFERKTRVIRQIPETDCKIYSTYNGVRTHVDNFDGFEVILPDGKTYSFGGVRSINGVRIPLASFVFLDNQHNRHWRNGSTVDRPVDAKRFAPIAWHLQKIEDLNGNSITFEYESDIYRDDSFSKFGISKYSEVVDLDMADLNPQVMHVMNHSKYLYRPKLKKILGDHQHIDVSYTQLSVEDSRYTEQKHLVKRLTTNVGPQGSSVTFVYDAFESVTKRTDRDYGNLIYTKWYKPMLKKIIRHGGTTVNETTPAVPHYVFAYNDPFNIQFPFAGRDFLPDDWLGYAADNHNYYGLPHGVYDGHVYGSGSRSPQHTWSRRTLLKSVQLPSGGEVRYFYEPHTAQKYEIGSDLMISASCSNYTCNYSNPWRTFTYDPNMYQNVLVYPNSLYYGTATVEVKNLATGVIYTKGFSITSASTNQPLTTFLSGFVGGTPTPGTYEIRFQKMLRSNAGTPNSTISITIDRGPEVTSTILVSGSRVASVEIDDRVGNVTTDVYDYSFPGVSTTTSGLLNGNFRPFLKEGAYIAFSSAPRSSLRFANGSHILYQFVDVVRSGMGRTLTEFLIPKGKVNAARVLLAHKRPDDFDRHLGLPIKVSSFEDGSSQPYNVSTSDYEDGYVPGSITNSASWRVRVTPDGGKHVDEYTQIRSIAPRLVNSQVVIDGKSTSTSISYHWWAKSAVPFATYTSHPDGSVTQTHSLFSKDFGSSSAIHIELVNRNAILIPTGQREYRNLKKVRESVTEFSAYSNTTGAKLSAPSSVSLLAPYRQKIYQQDIKDSGTDLIGSMQTRTLKTVQRVDTKARPNEVLEFGNPNPLKYSYESDLIKTIERLNVTTSYIYQHRLLKTKTDPDGLATTFFYDAHNRLDHKSTNRLGATTYYSYYDADPINGKLQSVLTKTRMTSSAPYFHTFDTFDGLGRKVQSLALGTSLTVANAGQNGASNTALLQQTRYNAQGKAGSSFPALSIPLYNHSNGQQFYAQPAHARVSSMVYENSSRCRPTSLTRADGSSTTYNYGYSLASINVGTGYPASFTPGQLSSVRVIDADNYVSERLVDAQGQVKATRRYLAGTSRGSAHYHEVLYGHDLRGMRHRVVPDVTLSNSAALRYEYVYDAFDQLTERKQPGRAPDWFLYDIHGRLVSESTVYTRQYGRFWWYNYDSYGRISDTYLPNGTFRSYAPVNKVGEVRFHNVAGGAAFGQVQYAKTRMLDNASEWLRTDYTYDTHGRGNTVQGNSILSLSDLQASKKTINYLSNGLVGNSILESKWPTQSTQQVATPRRYGNLSHKGLALKLSTRPGTGTYTKQYNGELFEDEFTIHGELQTRRVGKNSRSGWYQEMDYTYDNLGRLTQINQPSALTWFYASSLDGGTMFNGPTAFGGLLATDPQERRDIYYQKISYGVSYPSSTIASSHQDLVQSVTRQVQGRRPVVEQYGYDASLRLAEFVVTEVPYDGYPAASWLPTHAEATYSYDRLSRPTQLSRSGYNTSTTPTYTQFDNLSYSYGSIHHAPTSVSDASGVYQGRAPSNIFLGSNNQLSYNTAGDVLVDENKDIAYMYNELGLVKRVDRHSVFGSEEIRYRYAADGTLVESYEQNTSGAPLAHVYYRDGQRYDAVDGSVLVSHEVGALRVASSGTTERIFYYTDHLGNVMLAYYDLDNDGVIEPDSELLEESGYYPYGLKRTEYRNQAERLPYAYNGAEENSRWDLHFTPYRTMAPELAVWGQVDPKAAKFQGYSPYLSMLGSPISNADPDGDEPISLLIGASIGIISNGIGNTTKNRPFFEGAFQAAFFGAMGGGISSTIGMAATQMAANGVSQVGIAGFQAGAHGISGGLFSSVQGGNFWQGLASGGISSAISSGVGLMGGNNLAVLGGGAISGGIGAAISGGDFLDGFVQGTIASGLNHLAHDVFDPINPPRSKKLPGFPGAEYLGKKSGRHAWRWNGKILEWDSKSGAVEMYNRKGNEHIGEFDHETGKRTRKGHRVPGRVSNWFRAFKAGPTLLIPCVPCIENWLNSTDPNYGNPGGAK